MEKLLYIAIVIFLAENVLSKAVRISGGEYVKPGQYPFFAQLKIGNPGGDFKIMVESCGGTLLHPGRILTAAHCFKKEEMIPPAVFEHGWVQAYMGTEKIVQTLYDERFTYRIIQEVRIHKDYEYKAVGDDIHAKNDVAIAILKERFELSDNIRRIRLPDATTKLCQLGTIIGGGLDGYFIEKPILKFALVEPQTIDQISKKPSFYNPTVFYSEVKWYGGHAVPGDSGGPYVCGDQFGPVQHGIITGGYSNKEKETSIQEFEMVAKHLIFIDEHIPKDLGYKVKRIKGKHKKAIRNPQPTSISDYKKPSFIVLCMNIIVYVL